MLNPKFHLCTREEIKTAGSSFSALFPTRIIGLDHQQNTDFKDFHGVHQSIFKCKVRLQILQTLNSRWGSAGHSEEMSLRGYGGMAKPIWQHPTSQSSLITPGEDCLIPCYLAQATLSQECPLGWATIRKLTSIPQLPTKWEATKKVEKCTF